MSKGEIVKRGEIRSRKFYVVRRNVSGSFESIVYSHLFGDEFGRDFFCGYLDVTGTRFDGKRFDEIGEDDGMPCEITYGGRCVPGVGDQEASEHPGWFLGFDTAHAGMGDEDAESVYQTLVLLADAILEKESENAAIDAANISGAVRMDAEMERKEAWTLDNFVASLRQRSRDALAAKMQRYSDALDAFADNIEAAIKIERAGVSAMRDALEKSEKKVERMRASLRTVSEKLWAEIDPGCHDDCCAFKREIARIADAALAETGGAE